MKLSLRTGSVSTGLACALTLAFSAPALAGTVYVANNGSDSGTCGAKATPCRSITQGITNSAVGGKVLVGPGRYGDINGNGTLGEPGEEPGVSCGLRTCMINVSKQVSVQSSDGAYATVLDPTYAVVDDTVALTANGASFGGVSRGFTVEVTEGAASAGIVAFSPVSGNVVAGNVISGKGFAGGAIYVADNSQVLGNRVVGAGIDAISAIGDGIAVSGNTTAGWNVGIVSNGANNVITGNVSHSNLYGLIVRGTGFSVSKSSFVGNSVAGIYVGFGATGAVTACDIYGNDPLTNCGVDVGGTTATVTSSWWGAASGPGSAPANQVCNPGAGTTLPFATAPIKVKLKGIR